MLITTTNAGTLLVQSGDDSIELNVDDALTLFGRLTGVLPTMAVRAPEIERHDEHGWACPHCHADVTGHGGIVEYESHQGENDGEMEGDNLYISQVDTERETMAHLCGHCRRVVDIPGEIDVNWG